MTPTVISPQSRGILGITRNEMNTKVKVGKRGKPWGGQWAGVEKYYHLFLFFNSFEAIKIKENGRNSLLKLRINFSVQIRYHTRARTRMSADQLQLVVSAPAFPSCTLRIMVTSHFHKRKKIYTYRIHSILISKIQLKPLLSLFYHRGIT